MWVNSYGNENEIFVTRKTMSIEFVDSDRSFLHQCRSWSNLEVGSLFGEK